MVSTWQDELVSCWDAIYCWCRCQFVNCYHTLNLSMPLFSYTECRKSPLLFCNHYFYELFNLAGWACVLFCNQLTIALLLLIVHETGRVCRYNFCRSKLYYCRGLTIFWPSMFSHEQSLQTSVWNFRVSIYWYIYGNIYGIYPPFLSKAKGLDYPSPLQITLLPILQIL